MHRVMCNAKCNAITPGQDNFGCNNIHILHDSGTACYIKHYSTVLGINTTINTSHSNRLVLAGPNVNSEYETHRGRHLPSRYSALDLGGSRRISFYRTFSLFPSCSRSKIIQKSSSISIEGVHQRCPGKRRLDPISQSSHEIAASKSVPYIGTWKVHEVL